jgi:hypothetical protein
MVGVYPHTSSKVALCEVVSFLVCRGKGKHFSFEVICDGIVGVVGGELE